MTKTTNATVHDVVPTHDGTRLIRVKVGKRPYALSAPLSAEIRPGMNISVRLVDGRAELVA